MEYGRIKGWRAGVNTKEGRATDHLNTPIIEVERMARRDGFKFWFGDQLTVETAHYCEVGQGGYTCRRR
jgi:hypothetical protein